MCHPVSLEVIIYNLLLRRHNAEIMLLFIKVWSVYNIHTVSIALISRNLQFRKATKRVKRGATDLKKNSKYYTHYLSAENDSNMYSYLQK